MRHTGRFLLLAGLVPALSACATITRGTEDTFVVETDPAGASVRTSNGLACASTPCALRMDRDSEFVVTIEKEGFETHTASVSHEVADGGAAGMAGNVLVGGLIGVAVDAGSGAMYDLVPNPLRVTLIPAEESPAESDHPRSRTGRPADAAPARASEDRARGVRAARAAAHTSVLTTPVTEAAKSAVMPQPSAMWK